MRTSSIQRLPKLERLLLDADVNPELIPLLRAIGFHAEFASSLRVNIRNDTSLLRWARRNRYFLVCHDKFKDKQTRVELYPEIYHRGGRIIQIGGGPSQDPYKSLAKLLMHRQEWLEWFKENEGIVIVKGHGVQKQDAHKLFTFVQREMPLEVTPERTLRHRKPSRQQVRRRPKKQPPLEQQGF